MRPGIAKRSRRAREGTPNLNWTAKNIVTVPEHHGTENKVNVPSESAVAGADAGRGSRIPPGRVECACNDGFASHGRVCH